MSDGSTKHNPHGASPNECYAAFPEAVWYHGDEKVDPLASREERGALESPRRTPNSLDNRCVCYHMSTTSPQRAQNCKNILPPAIKKDLKISLVISKHRQMDAGHSPMLSKPGVPTAPCPPVAFSEPMHAVRHHRAKPACLPLLPFIRRRKRLGGLYPDGWIPFPRGEHNDFIQKLIDASDQVLPVLGFIGNVVEHLQGKERDST